MPETDTPQTLAARFQRAGARRRITTADKAELKDLARYAEEIQGWANELDCQVGDFAANVEMLYDWDGQDAAERAALREQIISKAEMTAGALRAIGQYLTPSLSPQSA